jgi:hypothetical protein
LVGEISCLTCTPTVRFDGQVGEESPATTVSFEGALKEERDGASLFTYQLGIKAPVEMTTHRASVPGAPAPPVATHYEYVDRTCQGAILLKPGQTYEIYQSGGATYTLTVTPEPAK